MVLGGEVSDFTRHGAGSRYRLACDKRVQWAPTAAASFIPTLPSPSIFIESANLGNKHSPQNPSRSSACMNIPTISLTRKETVPTRKCLLNMWLQWLFPGFDHGEDQWIIKLGRSLGIARVMTFCRYVILYASWDDFLRWYSTYVHGNLYDSCTIRDPCLVNRWNLVYVIFCWNFSFELMVDCKTRNIYLQLCFARDYMCIYL